MSDRKVTLTKLSQDRDRSASATKAENASSSQPRPRMIWKAAAALVALAMCGQWILSADRQNISDVDLGERTNQEPGGFTVFSSEEQCAQTAGMTANGCKLLATQAEIVASELQWPFVDGAACANSHGPAACVRGDDERWRVRMTGFASLQSNPSTDSILVVPVFSSARFPGLYFPNGYPVHYGRNEPASVRRDLLPLALQPRSLIQHVCRETAKSPYSVVEMIRPRKGLSCEPLHSFVTQVGASTRGAVLFAPNRSRDSF